MGTNIGKQPIERNENQTIDAAEARPLWRRAPEDDDLLAQKQVLRLERPSRSDLPGERPGDSTWVADPQDLCGVLDKGMAFDGPAQLNVKLHHAGGRKPLELDWLTARPQSSGLTARSAG
jgi:hypothetical protein